ncbi:testis-expressed protein 264 homolog [Ischnura elegans]|uniref:testis-expressed protein 264 homolog n=1 Tax=Ischnura elegans TaxID=197161 RepID=UPI001ED88495|nr:testis-expressed protein 264 homolog [Ischnura elegans]
MMLNLKILNSYDIHICLIIVICICIAAVLFCFHYGLMTEVRINTSKTPFGKLTIAYRFSRGSYSAASRLFLETRCVLPNFPRIGIFYGNKKESLSPLCFAIGSVLNQDGIPPDEKMKSYLYSYGYRYFIFPEIHYAVTGSFPFRNSLSLLFAASRIYPRIAAYIAAKNLCAHPVIEIYGPSEIYFVVPLSRQNEFYIPEAEDLYSGPYENGYLEPVLTKSPGVMPSHPNGCGNGHLKASAMIPRKAVNGISD